MATKKKNLIKKTSYVSRSYDLGETYKFKLVFENTDGNYDPDNITVTVTSPGGVVTNPVAVKVTDGFYYISIIVNEIGKWTHSWISTKDAIDSTSTNTFDVSDTNKASEVKFGLDFNSLIVIEVDENIKMNDNVATLGSKKVFSFSTEYNPFYSSTEMLRVEMGSWASLVPDDSLALAIHWSSLEADAITNISIVSEQYFYARTRFVMYDAAVKLFSMPIGASGSSGKQKQLGDLLVKDGSGLDYSIKDLIVELKQERDEWWRVVNAGGSIVLGQGLGPSSASKGSKTKLHKSREWHDPWNEHYIQPTSNSLYRKQGESVYKHGFTGWNKARFTGARGSKK
jgi:hypothetical protein